MTIELHHATSYEVGATTSPAFSKFVAALHGGENTHLARAELRGEVDLLTFLDGKGELLGSDFSKRTGYNEALWRLKDDTLVLVSGISGDSIDIKVLNNFQDGGESAKLTVDDVLQLIHPLPALDPYTSRVRFWYNTDKGPQNQTRQIAVPKWDDIKGNYSAKAATSLEDLISLDYKSIENGRLLLMHGPPGGGKTTAIRALCNAWKPWCESEYVVDPEEAFGHASYLIELLLSGGSEVIEGDKDGQQKWRLLIMEDAEEFLKPGAKQEVGQSVARLLNFGDGLLGQGLNVLVLMTTNVEIHELHEAITRPGRCLSNINVPELTKEEATKWMGRPHEKDTLAKLFEAKTASQIGDGIEKIDLSKVGTYL